MTEELRNEKIRNIAIIAHVDHGKTTLVDCILKQAGTWRREETPSERVMDSMDLERERGITIAAKNCAVRWEGVKINILDTPGHADFGGEVERAMSMVDGCILLVDAAEGPLPQTRFVLRKALSMKRAILVVINKIDRKDARPQEILNQVIDLFIDLEATDDQLDFPVLYAIGRDGIAKDKLDDPGENLIPLFKKIVEHVPAPSYPKDSKFQMLVANLAYSDYVGRLAIGKVFGGSAKKNDPLVRIDADDKQNPLKLTKLQVYEGLGLREVDAVEAGDIAIVAGIEKVEIGDTICSRDEPKALPRVTIDEPTIMMRFGPNTSPFSGREGKLVQSPKIAERLFKETLQNVALKVEALPDESFLVKGRGEFQMVILLETMRREGFELSVGRPEIIMHKEPDGSLREPIEQLSIECDEKSIGIVSEKISQRRGRMTDMRPSGIGRVKLEFSIPSRGLIGYRNEFLTDTRGTGIMNSILAGYEEHRGEFPARTTGSLVSDRDGEAVPYAIFHLEPRGRMFVLPGDPVYAGMVIGEHNRENDLYVNVCKTKKLTNIRAAGRDENVILTPVTPMTLERAIEYIREDEMVEVTPQSIRIRKVNLRVP